MSTLTVAHAELAAGDRVTGYIAGGRTFTLYAAHEVAEDRRRAEDGAVALVHPEPNTYGVEWWLYPDQAERWIVERPAAVEPAELAAIAERVAAGATGYRAVDPAPVPLNVGELDEDQVDRLAYQLAAALPHMPHVRRVETRPGRSEWQTVHLNRPVAEQAKVGDVVLVGKYGKYQAAIVTKVGPKRLKLAHATPHGAREHAGGRWGTVFHPYEPRSACYVVTTADRWAARAVAPRKPVEAPTAAQAVRVVARTPRPRPSSVDLVKVEAGMYQTRDGRYGIARVDGLDEWDRVQQAEWGIIRGDVRDGSELPTTYPTMAAAVAALAVLLDQEGRS